VDSTNIGLGGEFFVLAQLAQRGLVASFTLANTKAVDILVFNESLDHLFKLEVKTTNLSPRRDWLRTRTHAVKPTAMRQFRIRTTDSLGFKDNWCFLSGRIPPAQPLPTGCAEATQQTALAPFFQPCLPGLGRHVPLGKSCDDTIAKAAPCPDGRCSMKGDQQSEGSDEP